MSVRPTAPFASSTGTTKRFDYQFAWYAVNDELDLTLGTEVEDLRPSFRCNSLSLGTSSDPMLIAFAEGMKSGVTSQIGAKLAVDAMTSESLELLGKIRLALGSAPQFVQNAFREANKQLYQYGTKMLSGGKIATGGLLLCFDGVKMSVGRTNVYEAYLFRNGELAQFFGKEIVSDSALSSGALDRFLGTSKQVLVDIASLSVQEGDRIFLTTIPLTDPMSMHVSRALMVENDLQSLVFELSAWEARQTLQKGDKGRLLFQKNVFCALLEIGSEL